MAEFMSNSTIKHQLEAELSLVVHSIELYLGTSTEDDDGELLSVLKETQVDRWPELLDSYLPRQLQKHKQSLLALLAALSQLSVGLYGTCAKCDAYIEQEILALQPTAQYCQKCSTEAVKQKS